MSMTATSSSARRASRAATGSGRRAVVDGRRGSGVRSGRDAVAEPVQHRVGVGTFLGHQVTRPLEAVHVGVRQPVDQVVEVRFEEHRVLRSAQEQGRTSSSRRPAESARSAGVLSSVAVAGMSATNPPTPRRRATVAYGARKAARTSGARSASASVGVEERGRPGRAGGEHAARGRDPQGERQRSVLGVMHRGVQRDDGGQPLAVLHGPAERHRPAPVVADGHDRTPDAEGLDQAREVGDALSEGASEVGSVGEAHLQLVHGDDAPRRSPRLGPRRGRVHERAPQVRPRRVAVHRDDRSHRGDPAGGESLAGVEEVPRATVAGIGGRPLDLDQTDRAGSRPGSPVGGRAADRPVTVTRPAPASGVQPGAHSHQQHAVAAAQGLLLLGQGDRDGGGPHVPEVRVGDGDEPRSSFAARTIAEVCTDDTWWVM